MLYFKEFYRSNRLSLFLCLLNTVLHRHIVVIVLKASSLMIPASNSPPIVSFFEGVSFDDLGLDANSRFDLGFVVLEEEEEETSLSVNLAETPTLRGIQPLTGTDDIETAAPLSSRNSFPFVDVETCDSPTTSHERKSANIIEQIQNQLIAREHSYAIPYPASCKETISAILKSPAGQFASSGSFCCLFFLSLLDIQCRQQIISILHMVNSNKSLTGTQTNLYMLLPNGIKLSAKALLRSANKENILVNATALVLGIKAILQTEDNELTNRQKCRKLLQDMDITLCSQSLDILIPRCHTFAKLNAT